MLRWTDEGIGDSIVDVVLSLDAFVKREYNQEIATASYSRLRPSLDTLDAVMDKLAEVVPAIESLTGHPGAYLRAIHRALVMFTRNLQGDEIPYQELIEVIQEVPCEVIAEEKAERLGESIACQLGNLGYQGSLGEQVDAWLNDTRIPADKVIAVADKFLARSKTGTLKRVISLPDADGINSVNPIRGVFWSGYSKYVGGFRGTLTFNLDRPWYEPVFAQILTHEGYPGHQAFYCHWDDLYQQGKWPIEAAYYLINNPTNALFEGGPETALHFLGWDSLEEDTPDISAKDKAQFRVARDYLDLQRIGTTNACYYVNTGQMNQQEAIHYMGRVGRMKEVEANLAYRFFTDRIQRTYYPAYYYGRWMIGRAYDSVTPEQRGEYFRILYDTPHTTNTFNAAISDLIGRPFRPFDESDWM